jgi:hypothetical protein
MKNKTLELKTKHLGPFSEQIYISRKTCYFNRKLDFGFVLVY